MQITQVNHRWHGTLRPRVATNAIIIHHTYSHDVSASEIHRWHVNALKAGIGYHFVIRADGSIETGRPHHTVGAHAINANGTSVGIALTGRFSRHRPTSEQMQSLRWLIAHLRGIYGNITVKGHRDVSSTECPGRLFPWDELEVEEVERVTVLLDGVELPEKGLLVEGRTFLPVRALENTRYVVQSWDGENRVVYLRSI